MGHEQLRIDLIRTFSGPNVYSHLPITLLVLDVGPEGDRTGDGATLLDAMGRAPTHVGDGASDSEGRGIEWHARDTDLVAEVAAEMLRQADVPAQRVFRVEAHQPGRTAIALEHRAEHATRYVLEAAVAAVADLRAGRAIDVDAIVAEARRVAARTELGPSTRAIVDAAERRNIPWTRIGDGSLVQLGYGANRRLVQAAMTSTTSCIGADIASDKQLAKTFLECAAIPVAHGIVVRSADEAAEAFRSLAPPVVVKPVDGRQGNGVTTGLDELASAVAAYHVASRHSARVLVEEMLTGRDYRILVVGGRVVAASERTAAHVVGDGRHTIEQLVECANQDPRRGDGHARPLTKLKLDDEAIACLERDGLSPASVPVRDRIVFLCGSANISKGGVARDVTDEVHPSIADICVRAARALCLDICGIDLIAEAIDRRLGDGGGIVEVNAAPGLRMHLHPSEGRARDVASAIVETLYPDGAEARIPIVAITGTNGKTTTTRMVAHVLEHAGAVVGVTTTDGIWIGGREVARGDTTGPISARTVLSDPAVEVAVLETARGGIVRRGLGYDWSDVAVITNVQTDHIGQDGITSIDDLLRIKSLVAERVAPGGTIVLNADDERLAVLTTERPQLTEGRQLALFSLHESSMVVRGHAARGGTGYLPREDGWIVELRGDEEREVVDSASIPITLWGAAEYHVANAMAAIAACRARGLDVGTIASALSTFDSERNEGRTNLYAVGSAYVLVDYGHNPGAYEALGRLTRKWGAHPTTCILSVPGDRWDAVATEIGRIAARSFGRVVISEDEDLRGRAPGEMAAILEAAVRDENASCRYQVCLDRAAALSAALDSAVPGEIILMLYEKLGPVREILEQRGASTVSAMGAMRRQPRMTA